MNFEFPEYLTRYYRLDSDFKEEYKNYLKEKIWKIVGRSYLLILQITII